MSAKRRFEWVKREPKPPKPADLVEPVEEPEYKFEFTGFVPAWDAASQKIQATNEIVVTRPVAFEDAFFKSPPMLVKLRKWPQNIP